MKNKIVINQFVKNTKNDLDKYSKKIIVDDIINL